MAAAKDKPDPKLKEYATALQAKYIDSVIEIGVVRTARKFGIGHGAVAHALQAVRKKAALAGFAPEADMTHAVPSPFVVKGVSSLYDKDGNLTAQWVKTALDQSKVEQVIRDFVASLIEDAKGASKLIKAPAHANEDLLAAYPIGDPHFGMYAWAAETGNDFDAVIAERITKGAVDRLVDSAPAAHTALIISLGDLLHSDDTSNRTPQHGYVLDVDTRHQKIMIVALKTLKHAVYRALEKHALVIVRFVSGNHDPHASFAIALAMAEHFSNNPRVQIDLSPAVHWYYRFGKVLIGTTHGDTTKMAQLPGVMAADRSQDWGVTQYRHWYCGHIHHKEVKEYPGVVVEYFRTLAARDAWHASKGYRAGRDMECIVHHKEHGEIERHRCDVGMVS